MSKDKKEEIKKEIREIFKDFNFGKIRYATNYNIDDFLKHALFLNEKKLDPNEEVNLSELFNNLDKEVFKNYNCPKQTNIPLFCFFNQKVKGKININYQKYGLHQDTHHLALFFNCEMSEDFEISNQTWPYFYFYQSKMKDSAVLRNIPESISRGNENIKIITNIFLNDPTKPFKIINYNSFLSLKPFFTNSKESKELILIDESFNEESQNIKSKKYGVQLESYKEPLVIKNSKISKLVIKEDASIKYMHKHLTIKNSKVRELLFPENQIKSLEIINSKIDGFFKLPYIEEMTFRGVHFNRAFLIDSVAKNEKPPLIIMEGCDFFQKKGEENIFNKNQIAMRSLGYEAYAMDFSSFANKSRYMSLSWSHSFIEKFFLRIYGYISNHGKDISRMFSSLIYLILCSYIIYFIYCAFCPNIFSFDVVVYSLLNSLGIFKILFSFDSKEIQDLPFLLRFLFFIHTALASIMWYLIIMWLKKRFGQK